MKKALVLTCSLLLVSIAGFGQTKSQPPLTQQALSAILGLPAASSCGTQPSAVRQAAKRPSALPVKSLCSATATCQFGSTVSCSSNVSASNCSAVDSNCSAGEPGHATCDGVTTSCPACCTGFGVQFQCCKCAQTDDCLSCCRCGGGTLSQCSQACS